MKKFIKENRFRQSVRIIFALSVAFILSHYVVGAEKGWLLFSTVVVMLTTTGSALYQGLWRFFLLSCIVVIGSLIFSSVHLLYMRMYSVVLGAMIGILTNLIILPDRVDFECRNAFIPILKSYSTYFSALIMLLLDRNEMNAEREKINVEKKMQALPGWVFSTGFDLVLQKGYCYFFIKMGQMGEILFAMHYLARYSFSEAVLNLIREPLMKCSVRVEQFILSLITVLDLRNLSEGIIDFGEELAEIEDKLKTTVSPTWEGSTNDVYLTEFIYHLRDLRNSLLKMAQALR